MGKIEKDKQVQAAGLVMCLGEGEREKHIPHDQAKLAT